MSKLVQSPAGVRRLERNARRWRVLFSSGFTRWLDLGMPRTASLPTSKPGRPQVIARGAKPRAGKECTTSIIAYWDWR